MSFARGKTLEDYIEQVYKLLLDSEAGPDDEPIILSRNVKFSKGGYTSEFDIYYEFSKAGVRHKVAIECKNHDKPIEISHVRNFNDKIRDFNVTGVFISNSGFQSGARNYAADRGILLFTTTELPQFFNLIALRLKQIYLPTRFVKGEPYYLLMESKNQELTGSYHIVKYHHTPKAIMLFLSKKLAMDYLHATIDFLILTATKTGAVFRVICGKVENKGHVAFDIPPDKLKEDYYDLFVKHE